PSYYDTSTYTQCEMHPAAPLYSGGILVNPGFEDGTQGWTESIGNASLHIESENNGNKFIVASNRQMGYHSPSQKLENLSQDMKCTLSAWLQIRGNVSSAFVKATVGMDNTTYTCAGNVIARNGCWSFLKGGFVPDWSPFYAKLYFESNRTDFEILVDSVSLQPFTDEEWRLHQQDGIRMKRMKRVIIHVTDLHGNRLEKANLTVKQYSRQFPLGSAISQDILGNQVYQVAKLDKEELQKAVNQRIESLVSRYAGNFINWDVSNEMLHFSFYEDKLGNNASDGFYQAAQEIDPWTPKFMNDYNVIKSCDDPEASVDAYIQRLTEIRASGRVMEGIGLESHFEKPNIPFVRAALEKLSTLSLPIWLIEVDVNANFDHQTQ
ncbi:hypothetical protein KI387_019542, partial [Taxus chinensis]